MQGKKLEVSTVFRMDSPGRSQMLPLTIVFMDTPRKICDFCHNGVVLATKMKGRAGCK